MKNIYKIIIADDHLLFVDGLKLVLKEESDLKVVDTAFNGNEFVRKSKSQEIDVALIDINMPLINGLDALKIIKKSKPELRMIILSTYNDEHLIEKAKNYGADGYLLKTTNKEELLETIRKVASGQICFPYRSQKNANSFDSNDQFLRSVSLTKREIEIIKLIKKEFTNQQIADKLFLSIYTIETHRKNIMQKLKLKSPIALHRFISEHNI